MFQTLLYLIVLLEISATTNISQHEWLETVKYGFQEYYVTKMRPAYLDEALSHLQLPNLFRSNVKVGDKTMREVHSIEPTVVCDMCYAAASFIVKQRHDGITSLQLKKEIETLCTLLRIETKRVCAGAVDMHGDILIYIIDNNPNFVPGKICDVILQEYMCNFTNINWIKDLPDGQSPERPKPSGDSATYKILHVTDVHMDLMYTPNKKKNCNEPLCCQSDQDDGRGNNVCGYWAEYGNDVSENLVDEMIRFANTLDIDFVYFTGDIVSHRVWSTTQESNAEVIDNFFKKLKNGFKVSVYPTIGNHEPSPLNQFVDDTSVPSNFSQQWLLHLMSKDWSDVLGDSAMDTILKGGYYTVSPKKGFRIIALNNNVGYRACWWLLQHDEDPYEQLDWLISILSQAEAKGESVHILDHIPTGSPDLLKVWGREYNKIVNRFSNTIVGQFNGHVHVDTWQVHYNLSNPDQAINVAWNGASLTPYEYAAPSFKVYHVDQSTFDVVDIDQWTFDLTKANRKSDQPPEWYKIYSFRDDFKVSTLQPHDIADLLVQMAKNHTKLAEYHLYRFKNSEHAVFSGCSRKCQKDYLCELSTSVYGDFSKCNYLKDLYDQNL